MQLYLVTINMYGSCKAQGQVTLIMLTELFTCLVMLTKITDYAGNKVLLSQENMFILLTVSKFIGSISLSFWTWPFVSGSKILPMKL